MYKEKPQEVDSVYLDAAFSVGETENWTTFDMKPTLQRHKGNWS